MENIKVLEERYLKAKIAYYEGEPFLSDPEFDSLEQTLRAEGSKVINQVGLKRKDFDFEHPTRMLSLSKIQTEARDHGTYYAEDQFHKWLDKRTAIVGKMGSLEATPKFDGNAINIIYRGGILSNVLTRGDGIKGKDITKRMEPYLPKVLKLNGMAIADFDVHEVRAEVVIDTGIFDSKYSSDFANARNYVAGVIGKDDEDVQKVSELTILPLHLLVNGRQLSIQALSPNSFYRDWVKTFVFEEYEEVIKYHEKLRQEINYQLDGVVISFPVQERATLGENDHDPEWAVAIKFVPEETITGVNGIDWKVSKKGEIMPTLELEPVFLDGSTVSRASGYNLGYLVKNGIGPGAKVSIAKAGDIIPEVQRVVVKSIMRISDINMYKCPACGSDTEVVDQLHLMCTNPDCEGKIAKQLSTALKVLDIKGIGEKTIEPFAKDFPNMYEIIWWVLGEGTQGHIENYGIKEGSRSHELFVKAFTDIKSLTYEQVIQMLGYENVGKKLSVQIAREHAGLDYDYAHLEKELVAKLRSEEVSNRIKEVVKGLEELGISIDRPVDESKSGSSAGVCLTGSPKEFGFATKKEFLNKFTNLREVKITDKDCQFLVTDDLSSTSNKMKTAEKKGIEIKTYGDFS